MITFTIIESPYAPRPESIGPARAFDLLRHLEYVRAAMADCFARGEIPLASHALYTQPGVLADDNAEQRKQGMDAGFMTRQALKARRARLRRRRSLHGPNRLLRGLRGYPRDAKGPRA